MDCQKTLTFENSKMFAAPHMLLSHIYNCHSCVYSLGRCGLALCVNYLLATIPLPCV